MIISTRSKSEEKERTGMKGVQHYIELLASKMPSLSALTQ